MKRSKTLKRTWATSSASLNVAVGLDNSIWSWSPVALGVKFQPEHQSHLEDTEAFWSRVAAQTKLRPEDAVPTTCFSSVSVFFWTRRTA